MHHDNLHVNPRASEAPRSPRREPPASRVVQWLLGNLGEPDAPVPSDTIVALIRADLRRMMRRNMPLTLIGSVAVGLGVYAAVARTLDTWIAQMWLGILVAHTLAITGLWWRATRRLRAKGALNEAASRPRPWSTAMWASSAVGLSWGLGGVLLFAYAPAVDQMVLLLLFAGMGMGGIYTTAPRWRIYAAFIVPMALPLALYLSVFKGDAGWALASLGLLFIVFTLFAARLLSRTLVASLRLRYENAELIAELAAQRDAARTADSAKTRFLAAASHDLRQPLNALSLYLHTLRAEALTDQAVRVVEQAQQSSASLAAMFNGMMDAFRLEHGDIEPRWAQTRVWPLLERLRNELQPLAERRGLHLRLIGARQAREWLVNWDAGLVERMLRNLIDNALRHTERGGVAIVVRRHGAHARLQVIDTGLGMDEASLGYLMRPYDRVQTRRGPVTNRGGTGLGLAIVEHIARLCEVPWAVRSRLGRGTTVSLDLPWVGLAAQATDASAYPPMRAGMQWVGVAEDDPASLDALTQLLAVRWRVVSARSAAAFRQAVLEQDAVPLALLSDWRLGTDDGLAMLEELREEYAEPISCVLFSGEWSRNLEIACERSGMHYLPKPIAPSALLQAMHMPPPPLGAVVDHTQTAPESEPVRA